MSDVFHAVRGAALLVPWAAGLLAADVCLSALLPVSLVAPTTVYDLCSYIAYPVWAGIQGIFTSANGAHIYISPSSSTLPPGESAVVIANHVSWTDFYMIQALALRAGMLHRCRWFAKSQLRWVPLLGWGLWAMGMPLVTRNWTHDRAEMERVFGGIKKLRWPIWLIAYSEATRYTPAKHAETVRWCEANHRTSPRHTLWPRHRGFVATVGHLRAASHVRAVYDVTVAYAERKGGAWKYVGAAPERDVAKYTGTAGHDESWTFMSAPSMWRTISRPGLGDRYRFYVHVERTEIGDLPQEEEGLRTWLEDAWRRKDERLQRLKDGLEDGRWDEDKIANA